MVSDCVFPLLLLTPFTFFFYLPVCFVKRENREGRWGGGADLRGEGGGKTMIKMYYIYCMVLKKRYNIIQKQITVDHLKNK